MDPAEFAHIPVEALLSRADAGRSSIFGKKIELCAIINIKSGHCGMDCAFCAQSRHAFYQGHELLSAARLKEQITSLAVLPLRHIGLVSAGKALVGREFVALCKFLESLPRKELGKICLSLGQLAYSQLQTLKEIGVTRYHHNLETSARWYPHICTSQKWQERAETVENALAAGLSVCSGGIFGVGESWEDRADLARSLAGMGVENVPLNFLHPQPGTPMEKTAPLSADEGLRIIALFREFMPKATLRVCGGRPITFGQAQEKIFAAGANALMTGNYLTTAGEALADDLKLIERCGHGPV